MSDFKQCIHIEGKCLEDVFSLPCVISVNKVQNTYCFYLDNGLCADVGDWLCQDHDGNWEVLSDEQYKRRIL